MSELNFHGYKVVPNALLTKASTRTVTRTLKERLFTRPWQPFKKTREESIQVPDRDVLIDKINKRIYAHPLVVKEIEAAMSARSV